MVAPLTACLKKGGKLEQNSETLASFNRIKQMINDSLVFSILPPFDVTLIPLLKPMHAVLKAISEDGCKLIVACASEVIRHNVGIV